MKPVKKTHQYGSAPDLQLVVLGTRRRRPLETSSLRAPRGRFSVSTTSTWKDSSAILRSRSAPEKFSDSSQLFLRSISSCPPMLELSIESKHDEAGR